MTSLWLQMSADDVPGAEAGGGGLYLVFLPLGCRRAADPAQERPHHAP